MLIDNKDAIKLVEILKESKKLDQKQTTVSFNEDGTRCSVAIVWKSKKKPPHYKLYSTECDTKAMLATIAAWTLGGSI